MPAFVFFVNDTATTEIYTLSLHDALPICRRVDDVQVRGILRIGVLIQQPRAVGGPDGCDVGPAAGRDLRDRDRKSTRLNSSHRCISYAVFCLKKKITT